MEEGDIDLRNNTTCCFIVCDYDGYSRTFFMYTDHDKELISLVGKMEAYDKNTWAIHLSSFYDNYRRRLVKASLTYYNMTQEELIRRNGGRRIYSI